MNKRPLSIPTIILSFILLIGCSGGPAGEQAVQESRDATLTVKSTEESVTLNWDDIQELPSYEAPGGRISSVGHVTPIHIF